MIKRYLTRRDFIINSAILGALALGKPNLVWGSKQPQKLAAKADHMILLWLSGGLAQTESFDPKPYSPFERGVDVRKILSTFKNKETVVDGLFFSEGLERIAQVIDRGAVLRSFKPPDLTKTDHTRHQYHWHTGYIPPQAVAVPHIGSVIAKVRGTTSENIPAFVHIGDRLEGQSSDQVRAFLSSGYLGAKFAPFIITDPDAAHTVVQPPKELSNSRFESRQSLYRELTAQSVGEKDISNYQQDSLLQAMESAYAMTRSSLVDAFNLNLEPAESFNRYNSGMFGRGILLARRLIESGVRFVEVSSEYVPFQNFDTHRDGHRRTVELKKWMDAPIAQLVLDLEQRGLLDRTLIVVASEFGRSPGMNKVKKGEIIRVESEIQYGMHAHFTGASSIVMFGAGVNHGKVYGKTADEFPCQTIEDAVSLKDLHATIYNIMGIPADLSFEVERRPYYVTEDGKGEAIQALMA